MGAAYSVHRVPVVCGLWSYLVLDRSTSDAPYVTVGSTHSRSDRACSRLSTFMNSMGVRAFTTYTAGFVISFNPGYNAGFPENAWPFFTLKAISPLM